MFFPLAGYHGCHGGRRGSSIMDSRLVKGRKSGRWTKPKLRCHEVVVAPSCCTSELRPFKAVAAPKPLHRKTARQRVATPNAVPQSYGTTKPLIHRAVVPDSRCCHKLPLPQRCTTRNAVPVVWHKGVPRRRRPKALKETRRHEADTPRNRCIAEPLYHRAAVHESRCIAFSKFLLCSLAN